MGKGVNCAELALGFTDEPLVEGLFIYKGSIRAAKGKLGQFLRTIEKNPTFIYV